MKNRTRMLCRGAVIAALYVVLTEISVLCGLASMSPQCRLGEALAVLPLMFPEAVAGLTLGCLIANLLSGAVLWDVIFGTLATLLGALGCRLIARLWRGGGVVRTVVATLPNVVANTLIVPPVLRYAYHLEDAFLVLAVGVAAGELLAGTILGTLLFGALSRVLHRK
mgnify:CR=1 FL=1